MVNCLVPFQVIEKLTLEASLAPPSQTQACLSQEMEAQLWELVYGEKCQPGTPADCLNFPSFCWVFASPQIW